jgi:ribosomal protein S18 acetylase RimI-like enzyme
VANLKLREAKPADAPKLAEIHVAAWRAAYRGLMPDDFLAALSVAERLKLWEREVTRRGPAKLALADLDGVLAGFCLFGPTRDETPSEAAEIYAVNVHPDFWRQGTGQLLCEHAVREAAAREYKAMTLWTMTGNDRARRFYERLGYAADGAERSNTRLIGTPFDEMRYRKVIA